MEITISNKMAAFLVIGVTSLFIMRGIEQHILDIPSYNAVVTKNLFSDKYNFKTIEGSKEVVKEIEHYDLMKLLEQKTKKAQRELNELKEEHKEMEILKKLIKTGVKLTPEQLEDILPKAMKKMKEGTSEKEGVIQEAPIVNVKPRTLTKMS